MVWTTEAAEADVVPPIVAAVSTPPNKSEPATAVLRYLPNRIVMASTSRFGVLCSHPPEERHSTQSFAATVGLPGRLALVSLSDRATTDHGQGRHLPPGQGIPQLPPTGTLGIARRLDRKPMVGPVTPFQRGSSWLAAVPNRCDR